MMSTGAVLEFCIRKQVLDLCQQINKKISIISAIQIINKIQFVVIFDMGTTLDSKERLLYREVYC